MSTDLHAGSFAINSKSLSLKVRLPDPFSVALRKADIVAILFAFAGDFTSLHNSSF